MLSRRVLSAAAASVSAFALVALVVACGEDEPAAGASYAGSCAELASRCHPIKTPLGTECHDLGHDGDDAKCGPRRAECLAECPPTSHGGGDAAVPADASADASGDGGDPCIGYCDCMLGFCGTDAGTTFGDQTMCMSKCHGFTGSDLTCFASHCESAKIASDPTHDCEHASGDVACH